jgi:hypothetical protein
VSLIPKEPFKCLWRYLSHFLLPHWFCWFHPGLTNSGCSFWHDVIIPSFSSYLHDHWLESGPFQELSQDFLSTGSIVANFAVTAVQDYLLVWVFALSSFLRTAFSNLVLCKESSKGIY